MTPKKVLRLEDATEEQLRSMCREWYASQERGPMLKRLRRWITHTRAYERGYVDGWNAAERIAATRDGHAPPAKTLKELTTAERIATTREGPYGDVAHGL